MKQKALKGMKKEELSSTLLELQKNLMKENAQIAIGTTPKNPGSLKSMKKTIARINQLMHRKEE